MIGKTISQYKIIEKLGEGGMGIVYKAEDTKLDRFVALKFLPHSLNISDDERQRFVQEAKAAAAINHPNVCVIHDIQEQDNQQFIVMEFVQGKTLRELVGATGPVAPTEALNYAIQIGEALQAAHEKGVVHRDIKSENIMVAAKNQIKVMDFGLAKLKGSLKLTKSSSTLGTLAYMSPEQINSSKVDARSDIFSFGVVLFEMLTGKMPFSGDYEAAIMYSIVNEEPEPLQKHLSDAASELVHIFNRVLEKDPQDRYQSMGDLVSELRWLQKHSGGVSSKKTSAVQSADSAATNVTPATAKTKSKRGLYLLGAIGIAGFVALFIYFQKDTDPKPIRLTNPQKITQAIGQESWPTWSPDGSRIAYALNQNGRWDIWVKQLAGGEPINLTRQFESSCERPSWSPDGSQIAFLSNQRAAFHVWVMPAIGGTATRVASTRLHSNPVWSADGTRLAHVVKDSAALPCAEIYTLSTHEKRTIVLPGTEFERTNLSWSPQGDYFAYTDAIITGGLLRTVRLADGTSFQITTKDRSVRSTHWSADGRLLYFSSNRGGTRDLWKVKLNARGDVDGKPEQISNGLGMEDFAFSPDHTKIAYTRGETSSNLWRVAIPKSDVPAAQWRDAKQLTFESSTVNSPELSLDGKRIYFASTRSGNQDIWSMPVDGGDLRQLTTDPGADADLRFSPDGGTIAFYSQRSGNSEIWTMPATGGPARQITHDHSPKWWPRWSPDGQTLAYVAQDSVSKLDIWIIPAQGGEARQVTTAQGNLFNLLWWPDGQSLVTTSWKSQRILRFSITGGPPERLTEHALEAPLAPDDLRWSADKKHIYFILFHDSGFATKNIWSLSVADASLRQLTDFSGRPGILGRFFATDGTYFYFTWVEDTGDIWVMDVEQED